MSLSTLDALTLAVGARSRPAVHARQLREVRASEPVDTLVAAWTAAGLPSGGLADAQRRARVLLSRTADQGDLVLGLDDGAYPGMLQTLPDPPLALWVRGDPAILARPAVAVVGSRAARPGAVDVARNLARTLAAVGITVVSGMARGVDAAAHAGALETGRTVAVLGTGIDVVYPPQHEALARRIGQGGALVSEFLPGTPPLAHHFPLRNRVLSGLVGAVVVVEASEKSGSLITARLAAEQGRDVMAVPGDVRGGANRGGHALLRDGARLVESAADVLEELGWTPEEVVPPSDSCASHLLGLLRRRGGMPLDDLVAGTGRSAADLLGELVDLELAGLVARDVGGRFLPVGGKW